MNPPSPNPQSPIRNPQSPWLLFFKFLLYLGVFVLLVCVALGFVLFMVYQEVTAPGKPGEDIKVTIPARASGKEVAAFLAENGLVEHEAFFRVAFRLDRTRRPIKHGPYLLPKGLSPMELLHLLQEGPNRPWDPSEIPDARKVTVPEGLTIAQAAELFDAPQAFIKAAGDAVLIERLGIEAQTLEGFLMPDTYFFDEKPSERDVVERMVAHFEEEYAAVVEGIPGAAGRDKLEVVTVASLVEEEARVDEERPKIAAVICNRLKKDMLLQMDATLQYALGKYGERILYEDKQVDSPYNTYLYPGLPPGPISSPGVASLRAALQPAEVDYLYFVSNADGKTHTFSSTSAEHLRAVRKFRRDITPKRHGRREGESGSQD